ncbi:MAG: hypothetical protein KDN05_12500 [Verrucomicrobiae bacterium]|nr:hypothetical protein [Verrucomicrobiae bacterium]
MKPAVAALVVFLSAQTGFSAEEKGIPYNTINLSMKVLKSEKVDGQKCVPWYVKSKKDGVPLDPDKARFRVRTWDGDEHPLKIEPLAGIPKDRLSDADKKRMDEGYTHLLWIPKSKKEFMDGDIVHSFGKDSVEMVQGRAISGKIP